MTTDGSQAVAEQGTPDMFAVAKKSDIDQAAEALSRLSMENPGGLTLDDLKKVMQQAGIDKLAGEMANKAKIINLDYQELVNRFLGRYESKHTRIQYKTSLDAWTAFCTSEGINPLEASGDMADKYSEILRSSGLKASTVNIRINSVSSFYSYLVKRDHLLKTPFMDIRRARVIENHDPIPTRKRIMKAVPPGWANKKQTQIHHAVMIMLATGCRIGALATMKIDKAGNWIASSKGKTHSGRIEGRELAMVARAALVSNPYTDTGLFTLRINRAFHKAGIKGGAHLCRHRFALDLYKSSGNDPEAVRRALGHKDISITTAYLSGIISE